MKLYYTNSQTLNTLQESSLESLGGFISNSPVSNDTLNNLFDSISEYSQTQRQTQYRAIALKNETETAKLNLRMWVEYENGEPSEDVEILVAAALPNSSGKLEKIPSVFSKPFSVTEFFETSSLDKLEITDELPVGATVGIWIQRLIKEKSPVFDSSLKPSEIKERIQNSKKEEKLSIFFEWD